jgi:hypothetical protein
MSRHDLAPAPGGSTTSGLYHFDSEILRMVLQTGPGALQPVISNVVDRFIAGQIQPMDLEGVC